MGKKGGRESVRACYLVGRHGEIENEIDNLDNLTLALPAPQSVRARANPLSLEVLERIIN